MKFVISDTVYEDYKKELLKDSEFEKDSLEKDLKFTNLLKEIDYAPLVFISLFLSIFVCIVGIVIFEPNKTGELLSFPIAYLITLTSGIVACGLSKYFEIKDRIKELNKRIDACSSSPDAFKLYLECYHPNEYELIETMLYLKENPDDYLNGEFSLYQNKIKIHYSYKGLVKPFSYYLNLSNIEERTDIDENTLIWKGARQYPVFQIKYKNKEKNINEE